MKEQQTARVVYEPNESIAATVCEGQLRQEYEVATAHMPAELSAQTEQHFSCVEHEHRRYAQTRLETVEAALGSERAQRNPKQRCTRNA